MQLLDEDPHITHSYRSRYTYIVYTFISEIF